MREKREKYDNDLLISRKARLIVLSVAILLPLLFLGYLTLKLSINRTIGYRVQLRIIGYDPRDLLAGHYLTYHLDLKKQASCNHLAASRYSTIPACLCIQDKSIRPRSMQMMRCDSSQLRDCITFVRGNCSGTFTAGIEKYFIPQSDSQKLDDYIRQKGAWIELSIDDRGNAQAIDLLLE